MRSEVWGKVSPRKERRKTEVTDSLGLKQWEKRGGKASAEPEVQPKESGPLPDSGLVWFHSTILAHAS